MSLVSWIAFAAVAQTPALPNDVALVYSGVPGCAEARQGVRFLGHSVTANLSKETISFETLSVFKNNTDKEIAATIVLPVSTQNPTLGRGYDIRFKATWDKAPVTVKYKIKNEVNYTDPNLLIGPHKNVEYQKIDRFHGIPVLFKPKSTHSLRLNYQTPVGKGGADGMNRWVAYDMAHASHWGPIDQINVSVKFEPQVVFQTIQSGPNVGWQVGPKGAFFKQTGFLPGRDTLARYVYYPNGFDRIGQ